MVATILSTDNTFTPIVDRVNSIFESNVDEILVLGSFMKLYLSKLGYMDKPNHEPRDIDILVKVKDIHKAIAQFEKHNNDPVLHIAFNERMLLDGATYLKIYPDVAVNYHSKSVCKSLKIMLRLSLDILCKNPYDTIGQLWVLRYSVVRCLKGLRYPFFDV